MKILKDLKYRKEYIFRINRVIDYINNNLNEKLTIKDLAEIANFSHYHFHRVFKAVIRENLYSFIKRIRLEKSMNMLMCFPEKSITDIAFECGFLSSANFAYAFKENYGMSASEFRIKHKKNCKLNINALNSERSKIKEDKKIKTDFCINIKKIDDFKVIYIRHIGSYYKVGIVWDKLCKWAGARNLITSETKFIGLSYDNPKVTNENNLRYDACLTIENEIEVSGLVNKNIINGGLYSVMNFNGYANQIMSAYQSFFSDWLIDSPYVPDDRNCFEIYNKVSNNDTKQKFDMDIYFPIKPMN